MKKGLIIGLLLCVTAAGVFASPSDGIFACKVGQFDVYMMVERETAGNAGILAGADPAILQRLIPAAGFKHSTNTFLIKMPGRNIVIDTGFGGAIFDKINKLGVPPEKVDAVLLTHMHGDHIGGLQKDSKACFPNAKVYVSAKELEFFTKTNVNQAAVDALKPYGSNVVTFDPAALGSTLKEILPGVSPFAAYGHTPGHSGFLVENGGAKLLIAGDFLHVALVQFAYPDISTTYDADQKAAAVVRRQILDYAAKNQIPVAGAHIVYPALGTVTADGNGYKFTPSAE